MQILEIQLDIFGCANLDSPVLLPSLCSSIIRIVRLQGVLVRNQLSPLLLQVGAQRAADSCSASSRSTRTSTAGSPAQSWLARVDGVLVGLRWALRFLREDMYVQFVVDRASPTTPLARAEDGPLSGIFLGRVLRKLFT